MDIAYQKTHIMAPSYYAVRMRFDVRGGRRAVHDTFSAIWGWRNVALEASNLQLDPRTLVQAKLQVRLC